MGAQLRSAAGVVSLLVVSVLLSGCETDKGTELNNSELQALVSENYFSPQIRNFELLPLVNAQVYLDTPELTMIGDGQPLAFSFTGQIDADLFGSAITDRMPLEVSGTAGYVVF